MIEIILLLGIGLIAGVVSSMLGVGGGIILVPMLILLMKLDSHQAIGTSLTIIIPTVIVGAYSHYRLENVNTQLAIIIAIGAVAGAVIGTHIAEALPSQHLKKIFGVVLFIIAIKMILEK
ncbi:MAG: sulfite exporter TauE/SafE family protein [Deltaproteobacteria bacterium]|nr:MAG: sulfite exporter TauE/SafE family protein [Deltaproteobacteria bacterium]